MIAFLLCISLALAQDTADENPAPTPWEVDWAVRDSESTYVAQVGGAAAIAGPLVLIAASASVETPVGYGATAVGAGAITIGPAMLAGGSLRARRSLAEQGVHVNPAAGHASIALYGVFVGSLLGSSAALESGQDELIPAFGLGILGGYVGSIICGNLQLGANRRARDRAGKGRREVNRRRIE